MSSTVDGKPMYLLNSKVARALLEMDRRTDLGSAVKRKSKYWVCTGFRLSNRNFLKLKKCSISSTTADAADTTPVLGAGGQKTYRFTATTAGEELLHLKHARAWEKTAMAEWTCRVRVS